MIAFELTYSYFSLKQITFLETTVKLDELATGSFAFTFLPTAFSFNPPKIKFMNFFKWKRAAVVYDLIAMGKIKIEFEEKKFLFVKYTDIWVKVSWIEYILLLNSGIILMLLGREFHFSLLPLLRLREKNKINSLCCSL